MGLLILLWILSICYRITSGISCWPILAPSQLTRTGVIVLNNATSLYGMITLESEEIPDGGVLEFLIDREDSQGNGGRYENLDEEQYDVLLRIEFTPDKIVMSNSIIGEDLVGEQEFLLNPNRTEGSPIFLQLLGSEGKTSIKIFGNALEEKLDSYQFSENFLRDMKFRMISKTFELSVLDFCSTSYPEIVCEPDLYQGLNSDESLTFHHSECVETLVIHPDEERLLKCVGYGAPVMGASWDLVGKFDLVGTDADIEVSHKGCYAFQTTKKLVNSGAESLQGQVTCEIWNKHFLFPHRYKAKKFIITFVKRITEKNTTPSKLTTSDKPTSSNAEELVTTEEGKATEKVEPVIKPTEERKATEKVESTTKPALTSKIQSITTMDSENSATTRSSDNNPLTSHKRNSTTRRSNITLAPADLSVNTIDRNPGLYQPSPVTVYILSLFLVSCVVGVLCFMSAAICRKRQGISLIQLDNLISEQCRKDSVPKIAVPPVPKCYERQKTTSTVMSCSVDEDPAVEHIYQTIDEAHDPDYCYAWTVPPVVLQKSKVDVQLVLTPTSISKSRSEGYGLQSSGEGKHSIFSQSTSGASAYQRTYSNTGICSSEDLSLSVPAICVDDVEFYAESATGPYRPGSCARSRAQRQFIKSEYISLAAAKAQPGILHLTETEESIQISVPETRLDVETVVETEDNVAIDFATIDE
ncbi:uncharacterized protein LOC134818113 [Bolinopsis microptera]|uniref:uncharacterized protein LOC134818113 n=1 Tax=Bolinopsis microptera TaxID=2820187 RepID=UPI00307A4FE8